ncbi:MAG: hypothetical protein EG822_18050 [Deltaproteobacteria bacterium]|nr:hypothetical protein [Deltaproteobacteria bacterium]TLN00914.1 MAG: hypothetical protein FDZ73_17810 [bacterium]
MATIKPPKGLSPEARKIWIELQEEYGIDDAAGLQLLNIFTHAFDRAKDCKAAIDKEGLQVADRFGVMKSHCLTTVERDARGQMMTALKALNIDVEVLHDKPGRPPGR